LLKYILSLCVYADSEGHNVMKHNSFKICVNSQYPVGLIT